jgi:CHAT domain-containing protein
VLAPLPAELPGSREEAVVVAAAYGPTGPVLGRAATEGALRSALAGSAVVHVATHGVYDGRSPMFSGIRLVAPQTPARGPARGEDDGRLETHEVLALRIASQLVFLSGCETALGPSWSSSFEGNEDYATLAQAFLFSGARNVVATLWRIEDRSAATFSELFYRALPTASPSVALAATQRQFIRSGRFRHPYYWAAYVVSGSGSNPRTSARSTSGTLGSVAGAPSKGSH